MKSILTFISILLLLVNGSYAQSNRGNSALMSDGVWRCSQIIDYEYVVDGEGWIEEYRGNMFIGTDAKPSRFKVVKSPRSKQYENQYELTFSDGYGMMLTFLSSFVMVRSTPDHAYLCLKIKNWS